MKQQILATWALALAGLVSAAPEKVSESSLTSKLMKKRDVNAEGNFELSFFHVNDVHAHLDQFTTAGTDCTAPSSGCYGGYARIKYAIDHLRPQYANSLVLDAGDEFQGTLFYTYYKGEKIAEVLNQIGIDAMTLGNHEFDDGDDLLAAYLASLNFPTLVANIETTNAALNKTIVPYKIFKEHGVAVIGCITETTPNIANPGAGTEFLDVVTSVQAAIDEIKATTNIKRIVALTHIGYEEDQKLAAATTGLSLIMGGHSHTKLGNLASDSEGPYPTIVNNKNGDEVFIVTAWRWGEYLGYIDVTFDKEGRALSYNGGPIHLDNTTTQDSALQAQIEEWRAPFAEFAGQVIGSTVTDLVYATCQYMECTLGNVMADAIQYYRAGYADFSIHNAGGIRAAIPAGDITRGETLTSFPFGNSITEVIFSGADLLKLFEGAVSGVNQFNGKILTSAFQISREIQVKYNPSQPIGSKLVAVLINGVAVDTTRNYTVATIDFVANGGDNIFPDVTGWVPLDLQQEVLVTYINKTSPINATLEGRIKTVTDLPSGSATSSVAASSTPPAETLTTEGSSTISSVVSTTASSSASSSSVKTTSRASTRTTGRSSSAVPSSTSCKRPQKTIS